MLENLQLCARAEYDDNYHSRRQAADLTPGEALMAYFRVEEDERLAIKLPVVIGQISLRASGLHAVRVSLVNPDMKPYKEIQGLHKDGVWNGHTEKSTVGKENIIRIGYDRGQDIVHGRDAVFGDYSDDTDQELLEMLEKELVLVGSSSVDTGG